MYRTTLGHARLTQHPTVVMRLLDFEDRSRVFKFWFTWGQFRDRMFLGRSEHDRDSVLAQNANPKRPSTPAGRNARVLGRSLGCQGLLRPHTREQTCRPRRLLEGHVVAAVSFGVLIRASTAS